MPYAFATYTIADNSKWHCSSWKAGNAPIVETVILERK